MNTSVCEGGCCGAALGLEAMLAAAAGSGGWALGSGAALLAADAPGAGAAFALDCGGVGGLAAAGRLWLGLHKQKAMI